MASPDYPRLQALADEALAARRRLAQLADTLAELRRALAPPAPAAETATEPVPQSE